MTRILFTGTSSPRQVERWRGAIARHMPEAEFRAWPDHGDPAGVDILIAWRFPRGMLTLFPNLRLICSLGAGVDHIFADPDLPDGVPITRIVDPDLSNGISEYVVMATLRHHRGLPEYEAAQRAGRWEQRPGTPTAARRVGLLGCGMLGRDAAAKLRMFGFPLAAWVRTPRTADGIEIYAGDDQLGPFLARCDILVCMLPLTPATTGIINTRTIAQLPSGAFVINVARGRHIVDEDLIAALDSGHLAGATLDVFATEPLPPEHAFWRHPKITLTPHIASLTSPDNAAAQICDNIRRLQSGAPLLHLVDREAGY